MTVSDYDVYEELEKPDQREILFINRILEGKFEFSSYEEIEDIFHPSCNDKNDNSNVIINGVTCANVISLHLVDKLPFEEEDYTFFKEKDDNVATEMLLVSSLLESNFKSFKWQGDLKINQRRCHFSREGSVLHNNMKMCYFSVTTLVLVGYVLLASKLLKLLIYLQMLKKKFSQDSRTSSF